MIGITTKKQYNWHAVYLRSRTEKKVFDEISNKRIECYLPLRSSKRVWSDRVKIITEPVLPGYIFVRISLSEYYDVLVTNGVLKYVCFDNKPAVVSDYQINLLKLFVEHLNDKIEVSSERLRKGTFVKIINGPLKNVVGEVSETRGKSYLILRFEQLGYTLQVDLSQNEVEILPTESLAESIA
ncbi:UpxY family transcription antiterminator [Aquipluma nitroreducens]|nr:UpxY family transcription antiterminator [Aquipluma nitroreducens]